MALTLGTPQVFEDGTTSLLSVTALSSTQAVVAYVDAGDSDKGKAAVLDVTGTTVSAGTPAVYNNAGTDRVDVVSLSSTKAMVVYRDDGNSNYPTAAILDVSGSTITPGSEAVIDSNATDGSRVVVEKLTSTKAIAVWVRNSDGKLYGCVLDVSGSTITPGSATVLTSGAASDQGIAPLDSTHVLIHYDETGRDAMVLTIAGTNITTNTVKDLYANPLTGGYALKSGILLDTNLVLVESSTATDGRLDLLSISGTTITIEDQLALNTPASTHGALAKLSATKAGLVYYNWDSPTHRCRVDTFTISGGTSVSKDGLTENVATLQSDSGWFSATDLTSTTFLVVYRDNGDSQKGTAVVVSMDVSNARFYQGAGTLAEKFTLPFTGVNPGNMTLNKSLGTVVIGSDAAASSMVVYSDWPYPTGTASGAGIPTGTTITSTKWV